ELGKAVLQVPHPDDATVLAVEEERGAIGRGRDDVVGLAAEVDGVHVHDLLREGRAALGLHAPDGRAIFGEGGDAELGGDVAGGPSGTETALLPERGVADRVPRRAGHGFDVVPRGARLGIASTAAATAPSAAFAARPPGAVGRGAGLVVLAAGGQDERKDETESEPTKDGANHGP